MRRPTYRVCKYARSWRTNSVNFKNVFSVELHSASGYPYESFAAPADVEAWARDDNPEGYKKTTLVLHGAAATGKTELAKALCVRKGWKFLFVSDVDALREAATLLPDYALILDEADYTANDVDWVKNLLDVENDRSVRVRWRNM